MVLLYISQSLYLFRIYCVYANLDVHVYVLHWKLKLFKLNTGNNMCYFVFCLSFMMLNI